MYLEVLQLSDKEVLSYLIKLRFLSTKTFTRNITLEIKLVSVIMQFGNYSFTIRFTIVLFSMQKIMKYKPVRKSLMS